MFGLMVGALSATLDNLKLQISKNKSISKKSIRPEGQRIFYMGRELKNTKRSLRALGIGKFNIFVIHLHSIQKIDFNSQDDSDNDDVICVDGSDGQTQNLKNDDSERSNRRKRAFNAAAINIDMASSIHAGMISNQSSASTSRNNAVIVDLLEDSDDDDIEVVEVPTACASTKRSRRI
mmetsp:Transcript_11205/g.12423  ORF Transcript_11205/g.12423 Transcript_11205/m.12423 type:complete len:178 (+) Transcript_11205:968-1501(+)